LTRGDNIAWTEQFGNDNVSDVYQGRDLNNATISQRGDRNRAYAHQYTDGNIASQTQNGDNNYSHIDQYGGNLNTATNIPATSIVILSKTDLVIFLT
jgi:hypothetical protein